MELLDRTVKFRVCDIYLPEPQVVVQDLFGESVIEGKILSVTDRGQGGQMAIIEIEGLVHPVIVPVDRLVGAN